MKRFLQIFAVLLLASLPVAVGLAQIGPYSGPGGSQATNRTVPQLGGVAGATASTASPTGTASTTAVMCGCGVLVQPASNGQFLVFFTFSVTSSVATDGAAVQIAYGFGNAPGNGTGPVGTTVGSVHTWVGGTTTAGTGLATVGGYFVVSPATGGAPGGPIWVDLQFKAVTGGTATLSAVDAYASEQ